MKNNEAFELEDIQDEIVSTEQEPNHEALVRWSRQYPQHKEALTKFFAVWAVQLAKGKQPEVNEARIGNRMVSHALNLIHNQKAAVENNVVAQELRLCRVIRTSGVAEDEVLAKCHLDETLLAKLDRRLIRLASIPVALFQCLAELIRVSINDITTALAGDPIPLSSYKAKGKPSLKQESFLEAVASSELPDDAKKEWQDVVSSDKGLGE